MPHRGAAVKQVPRYKAWKVQKDREVFMTPEGPIIAERGAVVAIAIGESFEHVSGLLALLDEKERDER